MRLRATLTGESDLRLFSAVGVRRVSMLGTVLEGMLTKSACSKHLLKEAFSSTIRV